MRARVLIPIFFLVSIELLAQNATYYVYVASEAADRISAVRFGPGGAAVDHELTTGIMPIDIDGPHGLAVSPEKKYYYVSIAHGQPFGSSYPCAGRSEPVTYAIRCGVHNRSSSSGTPGEVTW